MMQEANGPALNVTEHQQIAGLSAGAKKEVATAAVQALGSNEVDAKKEIATTAVQNLGANAVDARKEIATEVLQTLSPDDREEVMGTLQPSQKISDRIWMLVVGSFAFVFVGGSTALVAGVFVLEIEQIQILLTLFTTVAGILAGFISGRASAGGGSRTPG